MCSIPKEFMRAKLDAVETILQNLLFSKTEVAARCRIERKVGSQLERYFVDDKPLFEVKLMFKDNKFWWEFRSCHE